MLSISLSLFLPLNTSLPLAPAGSSLLSPRPENNKLPFLEWTPRREAGGRGQLFFVSPASVPIRPAPHPLFSDWDQPPPSFQGALPTTGRGREITTSQFATDPQEGIRAERAQEGEGILEVRQERQHPGLQKKEEKRPQFSL
ncbi:uncharacterized protein LOC144040595 [Vanacampus margaritifer]